MGFGVSLLLVAAGAILAWAVNASSSTVNIHLVGVVLLIVGIIGLIVSMMFWSTWAGPGYFTHGRRTIVERDGTGVTEERTTRY